MIFLLQWIPGVPFNYCETYFFVYNQNNNQQQQHHKHNYKEIWKSTSEFYFEISVNNWNRMQFSDVTNFTLTGSYRLEAQFSLRTLLFNLPGFEHRKKARATFDLPKVCSLSTSFFCDINKESRSFGWIINLRSPAAKWRAEQTCRAEPPGGERRAFGQESRTPRASTFVPFHFHVVLSWSLSSCRERRAEWKAGWRSWSPSWGTHSRPWTWRLCWWALVPLRSLFWGSFASESFRCKLKLTCHDTSR